VRPLRICADANRNIQTGFAIEVVVRGIRGAASGCDWSAMGHKDPKMTMRYTHLSMDYKRAAVNKLPRFNVVESESQQISQQPETSRVVGFSK
jgi:hypothetical protein